MRLYNSALSNNKNLNTKKIIEECNYYKEKYFLIFKQDIIVDNLSKHYEQVDFFYADLPYPQGFKIFNSRANIKDTRTYKDLMIAVKEKILSMQKPVHLVLGKMSLKHLPEPQDIREIYLNKDKSFYAVWNSSLIEGKNTTELCENFSRYYSCMGDFMCGFGQSALEFHVKKNGKVVASDFDTRALGVFKYRLQK